MAFGFQRDPATGPLTFSEIIQSGGKIFDTRRKFTYVVKARFPWLYTGFRGQDVTTFNPAQIRQQYFGQIMSYWRNFSPYQNDVLTTGDVRVSIGDYWVEWDAAFKFPIDTTSDDPAARYNAIQDTFLAASRVQRPLTRVTSVEADEKSPDPEWVTPTPPGSKADNSPEDLETFVRQAFSDRTFLKVTGDKALVRRVK